MSNFVPPRTSETAPIKLSRVLFSRELLNVRPWLSLICFWLD